MIRRWNRTEPVRLYAYGLVGPLLALALLYGLVEADKVAAWAALAAAVLIPSTEATRARVSPAPRAGERSSSSAR